MKTHTIKVMALGMFQSNCSVVMCNQTKQAIVIDPGAEAERIIRVLEQLECRVSHLFLTHAHLDHVGAAAQLKSHTKAKIAVPKGDEMLYEHAPVQAQAMGLDAFDMAPIDLLFDDKDQFDVAGAKLTAIHTPGHSPGSSCLLLESSDGRILFSGDTLFRGSIGRTDLPGGSYQALISSVREKLFTLEPELVVIPGHGEATTIGEEIRSNPFF